MRHRIVLLTVFSFFFFGAVNAQSKKEQILALSNKIDSLNSVLNNERSLSLEKITKLNSELDLISKKLIVANDELIKVSKDFDKKRVEAESIVAENKKLESDLNSMKEENSRLKSKVDSAMKSSLTIEMVFVEGGTFQMGGYDGDADEQPKHTVTLNSFYIGKYEITQSQWVELMQGNPSKYVGCQNCPIENVSQEDVRKFILNLNSQKGKNYRLPTEAEWEYAAKGGQKTRGYKYSGSNDPNLVAWSAENSGSELHQVGSKNANELGVYDMSGNVEEWCSDWYGSYNYQSESNPRGPAVGEFRVLRGGNWDMNNSDCSSESRESDGPVYGNYYNGFRLVLPAKP